MWGVGCVKLEQCSRIARKAGRDGREDLKETE